MRGITFLILSAGLVTAESGQPKFNEKGALLFPEDYREWIYLSSGLGMTYGPNAATAPASNPPFDNVFVSRPAFDEFKKTGKWPEGTMFALEIRYSTSHGSINRGGAFQTDIAAVEVEVKDTKRFPGGWAYFDFRGGLMPARAAVAPLGRNAGCAACHETNGAVENTFTQFYPTALAIARAKGTLRPGHEERAHSPVAVLEAIRGGKNAADLLTWVRTTEPSSAALTEMNLNMTGYSLLQSDSTAQAVEVFEWATAAFPASANLQDSLSEAYEKSGQNAKSLESSRRALALVNKETAMPERNRERLTTAIRERITRLESKAK